MTRPKNAPVVRKVVAVGRYQMTGRVLGKGNFARVEEAFHTILKRKVAIKVIDTEHIKEEYVLQNLERESKLLAMLSHPCIAALYETIRCGSMYYLVMELARGSDMCSYIKSLSGSRLEERLARVYARQLVSAVAHMHDRGIVHRDLKMENIMLTPENHRVKIVDFGLSNIWTSECPLRTHCGSPEYAAPELFLVGRHYGPEIDLWSLGVILYGMVTGRLPFSCPRDEVFTTSERRQRLLLQINRGLTSVHKNEIMHLTSDLRSVIGKLLQPNPLKRISIENLLYHPWITHHQRKMLRINPIRKMDTYWKSLIIHELAHVLDIHVKNVEDELEKNRFGELGGMFNIRVREQLLNDVNGDGITFTPIPKVLEHSHGIDKFRSKTAPQNSERPILEVAKHTKHKAVLETPKTPHKAHCPVHAVKQILQYEANVVSNPKAVDSSQQQKKHVSVKINNVEQNHKIIDIKGIMRYFHHPMTADGTKRISPNEKKHDDPVTERTKSNTEYQGPVHAAQRAQRRIKISAKRDKITISKSAPTPSAATKHKLASSSLHSEGKITPTDSNLNTDQQKKKENPIAKSIAEYVKNIGTETPRRLIKIKHYVKYTTSKDSYFNRTNTSNLLNK